MVHVPSGPGASQAAADDLPARRIPAVFGPDKSRCGWGGQILMMLQGTRRLRCVRRLQDPNSGDFTMHLAIHRLPPSALAGAWNLPAAITSRSTISSWPPSPACATARSLHQSSAAGKIWPWEPSSISARRSRENLDDLFGLFLGYANVICQRDQLRDFPTLLQSIARRTAPTKPPTRPRPAPAGWLVPCSLAPFIRRANASRSSASTCRSWPVFPMSISTPPGAPPTIPIRCWSTCAISPTGPLVPLVFTPTTLGDQFHFAMTYRSAIFSDAQAGQMADSFTSSLWPAKLGVK